MRTTRTTGIVTAALAAILGALPACGDSQKHPTNTLPVDLVANRPDGSVVLFTVAGIYVFDGLLLAQWNHIPLDALGVPRLNVGASGGNAGLLRYSLSADGTTAAVYFSSNDYLSTSDGQPTPRVAIYRIPGGDLLNQFDLPEQIDQLSLSPDGSLMVAINDTNIYGKTTMMDTAAGAPIWTAEQRFFPVWSPDSTTLFTAAGAKFPAGTFTAAGNLEATDARTGAVKWTTDTGENSIRELAVLAGGAMLAAPVDPPNTTLGMTEGDWPPFYEFWSSAEGRPGTQLPPVPHTWLYGTTLGANFACNATDICAAGLNEWNEPERSNFIHVYQPDGTVLLTLQTWPGKAIESMAISPDGNFITIANPYDAGGGATVYSAVDGSKLNSHIFNTDSL